MIKCEHARLIDHVLRQRRRRDNRRQNRNRGKKFQFDHWSPPAIDPVHSCGSSEAKTDVCASAFPARAEMPITVRRSGFYEAAQLSKIYRRPREGGPIIPSSAVDSNCAE